MTAKNSLALGLQWQGHQYVSHTRTCLHPRVSVSLFRQMHQFLFTFEVAAPLMIATNAH